MANEALPTIACNSCNLSQAYRGQADCIHCHRRLQNWSVASQLIVWKNKQKASEQYKIVPCPVTGRPKVKKS